MFAFRALAFGFVACCLATGSQAAILYDNTGVGVFGGDPIQADGPQGDSFTTNASGTVNAVGLMLDNSGAANPNGVVEVAIYDDFGGSPNIQRKIIGDIQDTQLSSTPSLFTFNNINASLKPNARYWIYLTDMTSGGASSIEWFFAPGASGTLVAGEFNYNGIAGALPNGDGTNGTSQPYIMAVASSGRIGPAVPEPASLAVLGLGLAGLGAFRLRRRP